MNKILGLLALLGGILYGFFNNGMLGSLGVGIYFMAIFLSLEEKDE